MSFSNYGEWELDHIIPITYAKTKEDVLILSNYRNFQPLWKIDNNRKNDKLPEDVEIRFSILKAHVLNKFGH